jgi:hypothetical protein
LNPRKFILERADGHNGGVATRLEGYKEQEPDEQDGDYADGQSNEEPHSPRRLRIHVLKGDKVLRRGDGGGGTANVRGEGDAEDEGFGHVGVAGEVTKDGLGELVRFNRHTGSVDVPE